MLSLDLFDSRYEKRLHEGAVDDAEYARLKKLGEKIDYLKQARAKTTDPEMRQAIDGRIKQYDDERHEILSVRGMKEAEQPTQAKTQLPKGIGDIQDPKTKMAQLAQKTKKGPLANVGAGLKAFVKGEPEPMGESYGPVGSKALGNANFTLLQRAVKQPGLSSYNFEFGDDSVRLTRDEMIMLAKAYNAYPSVYDKMDFIEYVLSDPNKLRKLRDKLLSQQPRPEFELQPPDQQDLLEKKSQKKKFRDTQAQRELEKARAEFPSAGSDLEALIKKSMSVDREQDQGIEALSVANQSLKQELDALKTASPATAAVPEPVVPAVSAPAPSISAPATPAVSAPATEPVKEPAKEPVVIPVPSAEKPKAKPKTKKTKIGSKVKVPPQDIDRPRAKDQKTLPAPDRDAQRWSQTLGRLIKPEEIPTYIDLEPTKVKEHGGGIGPKKHWQSLMRNEQAQDRAGKPMYQAREKFLVRHNGKDVAFFPDMEQAKAAAKDMMKDLRGFATVHKVMREGEMSKIDIMRQDLKLMSDLQFLRAHGMSKVAFQQKYRTLLKPAPAQDTPMEGTPQQFGQAVRMAGYSGRELEQDPAYKKSVQHARQEREQSQRNIERVRQGYGDDPEDYRDIDEMFAMPGTTVPRKSVIQGYTVFFNPETRTVSVTRGGDSEEAAIDQARIGTVNLKTFRNTVERLIDRIEQSLSEHISKEPRNAKERDDMIDRIRRMAAQERNPANLQIMNKDIEMLKTKFRDLKEDTAALAAEDAILKRIFVKHKNLMMEYGPEKITQAAEEVSYNVGDIAHITEEQIKEWVRQVEYILGARP